MYQALYRKYRPQTFSDVVGQEHITATLQKQIESGRLSHAYLFVGTRGTGKTSCAKILARAVNCTSPVHGDPCNRCAACRGILDGGILDVAELDAASNNGVDNVRALRDEAIFSPAGVKKRVYIIDEVHMLSLAAFNALLKILEEPPEHLMFILCTTELRKVPATIVSRCQRHNFRRLSPADIAGRLRWVAGQENIDLTEDAAALLGRLADGGMRDGLSLLDQCSAYEHIDTEAVLSCMGLAGGRMTAELLEAVCRRDSEKALNIFNDLWKNGKDPAGILDELGSLLRDVLLTHVAPKGCAGLISGAWPMNTLTHFAEHLRGPELMHMLTAVENAPTRGASPRRSAELCLVGLCEEDCGEDISALRARVARLERQLAEGSFAPAPVPGAPADTPEKSPEEKAAPVPPAPKEPDPEPEFELPPLPEEEDYAPAGPEDYFAPPPEEIVPPPPEEAPEAAVPAPVNEARFFETLLPRLEGLLETYVHSLLLPSAQTMGVLSGDKLTVYVSNPFALATLSRPETGAVIAREATALRGSPVTVTVTDAPAPAREPNREKLADLNKFANFKME